MHTRPIPFGRKIRILFLRWHRFIGIFSAGFMLFLAVSGLILNHAHNLNLDQQGIAFKPLLYWYGIDTKITPKGFQFDNNWLSNQEQSLYWNEQNISYCSQLNTAFRYQSFILALCNEQIIVLTSRGLLVEKLIEFPEPFKKMALDENKASIILAGESQSYSFDLENLDFLPIPLSPQNIISPAPTTLPSSILTRLDGKLVDHSITWERVLLDLHSGRFFGQAGILFVDLLALMFCMLSITGAWLWLRRH